MAAVLIMQEEPEAYSVAAAAVDLEPPGEKEDLEQEGAVHKQEAPAGVASALVAATELRTPAALAAAVEVLASAEPFSFKAAVN